MSQSGEKTSFVMYKNWALLISNLPDDLAGKLIKAISQYQLGEDPVIEDPALYAIYASFIPQMEKDALKWEESRKKQSNKAKQRWNKINATGMPRHTTAMQQDATAYQSNATVTVNVNDNVNVNENVNENVNGSPNGDTLEKSLRETKHKYGEYQHVRLTDAQYKNLVGKFGEDLVTIAIRVLDEYIQTSGKSYKDHNLVLQKWPIERAREEQRKRQNASGDSYVMRLARGEIE